MSLWGPTLNNSRGSVMLMGLGMITLATSMVIGVTLMANKEASQRLYERESLSIREINNSVQTLLSDQRFCSDFVKGGFAGTNNSAVIPFKESSVKSSGNSTYAKRTREIIKEYQDKFKTIGYEVNSIDLDNMLVTADQGQAAEKTKTFDITVKISKINQNAGGIFKNVSFGKDGINRNNKLEHISLALTEETGGCTVYKKAMTASTVIGSQALRDSCTSLGGTIDPNTFVCQLQKYNYLNGTDSNGFSDGVLDYSNKISNTSYNLSDALCEMEKNILRKDRKNVPSSYMSDKNKNWTNFCKKPQWGGCYEDGKYYSQGETRTVTHGMKAKKIKNFVKQRQNKTLQRRVTRLYMTPPQSANIHSALSINTNAGLNTTNAAIGNLLLGGLGAGLFGGDAGFGLQVAGLNFLAISAFGAGPGVAVVAIVIALMGKCDKGRVHVTSVCRDGKMEDDSFVYQTQRRKRFKCKWNGGKTIATTSEESIADNVNKSVTKPNNNLLVYDHSILKDSDYANVSQHLIDKAAAEEEALILKEISEAKTLVDLIEKDDEYIVDDEVEKYSSEVLKAYRQKEQQLLAAQQQKISLLESKINQLISDSNSSGANLSEMALRLNQLKKEHQALVSELALYNKYQSTISGLDSKTVSTQLNDLSNMSALLMSVKT